MTGGKVGRSGGTSRDGCGRKERRVSGNGHDEEAGSYGRGRAVDDNGAPT